MMEITAIEQTMIEKDFIIRALQRCIEMPERTEEEYEKKKSYRNCLEDLGIIQKNS